MKKKHYAIGLALIILALLIAGTNDYNEAKETEQYAKEQLK